MLTATDATNAAVDDEPACLAALQQAAAAYGGEFAAGLDRTWISEYRDTYRRQVLDVLGRIAELTETNQPDTAIAARDRAIEHDLLNEESYQHLIRIQGPKAPRPHRRRRRTLRLCEDRLATIDAEPTDTTRRIAARQLHFMKKDALATK